MFSQTVTVLQWLFLATLLVQIPERTREIGRIAMVCVFGLLALVISAV